ncbi:MAG: MATE family efflux transporter, partial [Catenibacillus sp.]
MEKQQKNKMGYAPITPLLASMALPAMISMLIQALYNVVDSIFVSRISSEALSAISLAFPVQMLMISVVVGTGVGINSLVARRLGEQRQAEANNAASHGIVLGIISWLIIALLGAFGSRPFFMATTDNANIIEMGVSYTTIVTVFCLFTTIQVCIEKTLQATGNMIFPMCSQLIGCISNIILDPILIFGYFGFPAMGIRGAAIATVTGQLFGMIFCMCILKFKNHAVHISLKHFRFDRETVKHIYQVGFPSIIMQAIGSVLVTFLNMILISFSEAAVNVLGIYYKLQSFVFMPIFGLTQGAMPILGYNYGAGQKDRMLKTLKIGTLFAAVIMVIGTLLFQLFPDTM